MNVPNSKKSAMEAQQYEELIPRQAPPQPYETREGWGHLAQHAHAHAPQHQSHVQPPMQAGFHPNLNPPYLQALKTSDQGSGGPCASVSGISSGAAFDNSRGTGTREREQERERGKTMVGSLTDKQAGKQTDTHAGR